MTKEPKAPDETKFWEPKEPKEPKLPSLTLSGADAALVRELLEKLGRVAEQYPHHWSDETKGQHERATAALALPVKPDEPVKPEAKFKE